MSDIGSQSLPFAYDRTGTSARTNPALTRFTVWPRQVSSLALLRQNAELRVQNAALTQALASCAAPPPNAGSPTPTPAISPPAAQRHSPSPASTFGIQQCLTRRQRQVLALVLSGCPSKNIAADLGISQRTVENHRAAIMRRTGATSVPALARLVIGAAQSGDYKAATPRHTPLLHAILCQHNTPPRKAPHAPK